MTEGVEGIVEPGVDEELTLEVPAGLVCFVWPVVSEEGDEELTLEVPARLECSVWPVVSEEGSEEMVNDETFGRHEESDDWGEDFFFLDETVEVGGGEAILYCQAY